MIQNGISTDQLITWFTYINSAYCAYKAFYFFFALFKIRGHQHSVLTQIRKNLLSRGVIFGVSSIAILAFKAWWLFVVALILDPVMRKIYRVEEAPGE